MTLVLFEQMPWFLLVAPGVGALACLAFRSARGVLAALAAVVLAHTLVAGVLAWGVLRGGPASAGFGWLRVDALSAFHLAVLAFVFAWSTVFAGRYLLVGELALRRARIFAMLWLASLASMSLVLVSNHLGLMWVGVETTTIVTTFLISFHRSRESLEATWKYLMICSVGIAIAFLGMLIFGATGSRVGAGGDAMLWTTLRDVGPRLDPKLAKLGFIFLLVGYGTKIGLAPMHTWLPDAHSQAPAPVSSIFSAGMLGTVFYCLMRYQPVVDAATGGAAFSSRLLCLFGGLSMIIAAAFILFQRDVKRLLAYCSVEHMGIVAIGLGLGKLGVFAAMFHTLNHALAKSVGFFAAGRLGQMAGSNQMIRLRGSTRLSPLWGTGLSLSLLALVGVVPSAVFMSELLIVKAAIDEHATATLVAFLVAAGTVFLGMFGHTMNMARGTPDDFSKPIRANATDGLLVVVPLALLAVLGLWLPAPLRDAFDQAAAIVRPVP